MRVSYDEDVLDWRTAFLVTHRWLGIVFGILFVAWFSSGIVMMYARMPALAPEERLERAPVLDVSSAMVSPAEAASTAGISSDRMRIAMLGNRPVYRFGDERDPVIVFADTGDVFSRLGADAAKDVARRYARDHDGPIRYDRYLTEPDQWTLQDRTLLPMHRFALGDEADTHLYVSEAVGDVVLTTTRRERFWAWLGPVVHWVYFTPLRRHGAVWSEVMIWSSLFGCVLCFTGLVWGALRCSRAGSPYTGLMKWHHYAGLLFGVVALAWVYSGLLSMEPFDWFATPGITSRHRDALTGGPIRFDRLTMESVRAAHEMVRRSVVPKELEVLQFRGDPFWVARSSPPDVDRRYVSAVHPELGTFARFDRDAMREVARAAMPDAAIEDESWLEEYDSYYYGAADARALPVLRVRYSDPGRTWLYFDPQRGQIVHHVDRATRARRWLYRGLHSLDFPFLYFRRPLWDIVVIALSIGGLVLSTTTLLPGWRRVMRHVRSWKT